MTQSDVADGRISRNSISDVENNKVRLVPSRALLIYEKLLNQACAKGIKIDLEFDEILRDNPKYQQLKYGYEIINELKQINSQGGDISQFLVEKYRLYAIRNEIGILKVYILMGLYRLVDNDLDTKVKLAFNALDFLKWQKFNSIYKTFDEILTLVIKSACKLNKYSELIHYYSFFEANAIDQGVVVPSRLYFNLGLFYKKRKEYLESYKYINRYIDFCSDLTLEDRIDTLIMLGNLSIKMEDIDRGIMHYEEVINSLGPTGDIVLKSFALSNLIYNVSIFSVEDKISDVEHYLNELDENIQILEEKLENISIVYLYMAVGYEFIGNSKKSKKYKFLSLHSCANSKEIVFTLGELIENSEINSIKETFLEKLLSVDKYDLTEEYKLNFYELVFKVLAIEGFINDRNSEIVSLIKELGDV